MQYLIRPVDGTARAAFNKSRKQQQAEQAEKALNVPDEQQLSSPC